MKPKSELPYLEWQDPKTGAVERLYADVITDESANLGAVVSQHAVETGSKITDHYRKEPEVVQVTYYFSGAPLRGDLDDAFPGAVNAVALKYEANKARTRPNPTPLNYKPGPGPGLALLNPFNAISAGVTAIAQSIGIGALPKKVNPSELQTAPTPPTTVNALTFTGDPSKRFEKAIETVRRLQAEGILVTVKTTFGRFPDCGIIQAEPKRTPDHGTSGEIAFSFEQLRFVQSDIALALPLPVEPRAIPKKGASAAGTNAKDGKGAEASAAKAAANAAGVTDAGSGT